MKTEILSFSPIITGSLIKELTKQARQTQPCAVLVSIQVLQRNRNLQHPDFDLVDMLAAEQATQLCQQDGPFSGAKPTRSSKSPPAYPKPCSGAQNMVLSFLTVFITPK